jgi:hypothetical protein
LDYLDYDGSLAQKEFALGVFLDVEEAFDNTSFESMDDAASDHGGCSTINRWLDFMLRSRSGFVDIRRVRVRKSLRRGYPQRGVQHVQSPLLLWNMMVDSLLNLMSKYNEDPRTKDEQDMQNMLQV